jgi:predicted component of type VI protein secretion system
MAALPAGFETLEPFVQAWALAGEAARAAARSAASDDERENFYAAAQPLMEAALAYLDGKPIGSLDVPDATLMRLMLSLANVYHSVEVLGDAEADNARMRNRLAFTDHAPY